MQLSPEALRKAFNRMDSNKSGTLSLAEIDKAMIELYPQAGQHKKSMMRAYKLADASGDGYIGHKEFGLLLYALAYFEDLYEVFELADEE